MFLIFKLIFEYIKRLHTKMNPTSCLFKSRFVSSYWLAHFTLMEKSAEGTALFWFGLRDVGILQIFYTHEPESKDQLLTFPHFWNTVWRK
jgi:hypothetical protein